MKSKPIIVILAVSVFSLLIIGQVGGADLSDLTHFKATGIIKVEKIKHFPVIKTFFSRDFQQRAETLVRGPVVYIENSRLAECYREQPFLFGFLTMFITISLGVLGFVFHLIRNDPRFH